MALMGKRGRRRDRIETALARVIKVLADLDEIILRTRQARRRSAVVQDVLDPAIERLIEMRDELESVQQELQAAWMNGQADKWD